ncbi:ATP-binding protein [Microbulbifer sp.]|uniref:ATP-binding protein n=1 Tax=Microbulbifer sp. TaxID=1908541 RepID=UPI002F95012A
MGLFEWVLTLLPASEASGAASVLRVLLATLLVGVTSYLLLNHKRQLTDRLGTMLAHRDALNMQYQQELRERQATEQTLSDQLQFLQILIDAIPAPIFYKDAEGIYTGCNRAFEAFLGKPREEIVGRSVYGVSPGPQAQVYHEKDLELMHQRGQQVYESSVVYADGTLHDVIFNKAAYELADGRLGGLIGVILDITERKTLERELLQAKEKAEFYSRSKTQFLTNMSHEIRTPLNAIVGFSQVLIQRSRNGDLPGEFREFLEKIAISGRGLAELVNDVLDISRIEAGKIEAVAEDVQLPGLINCILVSCEPQASERCLTLRCETDPHLPEYVRIDRGKLSQILINLIGNAIKFSPANSIIDLKLSRQAADRMAIAVVDRGIGIPPEQQAIIFEPFEQVDKTFDGQCRGTGLGLPITRSLVELLGGEISLESEANVGTSFTVTLPLEEGSPVHPLPAASHQTLTALRGIQALVFEDNAVNQMLMRAFCDDLGIEATFVSDGRQGIETAREMHPDIIFMDIQLPGLSGIEATAEIRQIPEINSTPIIGLSAAAFSEQKIAALNAGMDDYLTKPIIFSQLICAMQKHLEIQVH